MFLAEAYRPSGPTYDHGLLWEPVEYGVDLSCRKDEDVLLELALLLRVEYTLLLDVAPVTSPKENVRHDGQRKNRVYAGRYLVFVVVRSSCIVEVSIRR
jgi:hypothetical protein